MGAGGNYPWSNNFNPSNQNFRSRWKQSRGGPPNVPPPAPGPPLPTGSVGTQPGPPPVNPGAPPIAAPPASQKGAVSNEKLGGGQAPVQSPPQGVTSSGTGVMDAVRGGERQNTHGLNPGLPTNAELLKYYGNDSQYFAGPRQAKQRTAAHDATNSDLWDRLPANEKERWANYFK